MERLMRDDDRLDDGLQARDEASAYRRIELITGRRLRRRWSPDEKAQIVAESAEPGVKISEVARRCGVNRGLLTVWRRQAYHLSQAAAASSAPAFVPVVMQAGPEVSKPHLHADPGDDVEVSVGAIEVDLPGGRVRLSGAVDPVLARAVIAAVRARG
jgi:transposase